MRFLIPVLLMLSLAGYSQAQERLSQLPAGTNEVQITGQTYYQLGNTFYRFHPQGGYYYEVMPPRGILQYEQYEQPRFYRRSAPWHRMHRPGIDAEAGCRNWAADKANRNPTHGGKVYIRELNRCRSMIRQ